MKECFTKLAGYFDSLLDVMNQLDGFKLNAFQRKRFGKISPSTELTIKQNPLIIIIIIINCLPKSLYVFEQKDFADKDLPIILDKALLTHLQKIDCCFIL